MSAAKSTSKSTSKTHTVKKGQLANANLASETLQVEGEAAVEQMPAKRNAMDFAVQQLSAPVALTDPKRKEFEDAMQKLSDKFGVPVKAVEAKIAKVKVQQNSITRPAADTKCGLIFAAADKITAATGAPATIQAVKLACDGINDHTVKTQYARWRQYNGISGRLTVAKPAVAAASVVMDHDGNP